ncbi:putative dinucleotide-binding enzyme [Rhodococcus sp. 27YEA15]|uniref:NADPH-dependent F420 reductase n=1 Tax=Rhodococcus sp. 27YEA15 TaxID=3156259 RepID=UPI003C7AE08E
MKIAIAGTGVMARILGQVWAESGHQVTVAGRDRTKARGLADRYALEVAELCHLADTADTVLLAISADGVEEVLDVLGAPTGALRGKVVVDPINDVTHGIGRLRRRTGSMSDIVVGRSPGAKVVKALNLHPADHWQCNRDSKSIVPIAGDEQAALDTVGILVEDLGARAFTLGRLGRARQLEEVAGFVIASSFAGLDPRMMLPGA